MLRKTAALTIFLTILLNSFCFAAGTAQPANHPAPPIVITAPAADSVWQVGAKYTISWNYMEEMTGKSFKVILRNQNNWSTLLTYIQGSRGKAAWEWKVGDYVSADDIWFFVIETFDGKYRAVSPPFKVSEKSAIAALTPYSGQRLALGSTANISWQCRGAIKAVKILLLQNSTPLILAANQAVKPGVAGVFNWKIPTNLSPNATYHIRIQNETDPSIHSADVPVTIIRP